MTDSKGSCFPDYVTEHESHHFVTLIILMDLCLLSSVDRSNEIEIRNVKGVSS